MAKLSNAIWGPRRKKEPPQKNGEQDMNKKIPDKHTEDTQPHS